MAPRRRRKLAVGAGGSIGTLLADTRQAIADAERAAQKAEADAKKSAGQRLKQAQSVASNYVKDGSLTYEEAKAQLDKMLSEETDAEAKMYISDYITDLKTTRDTRDVNNLGEDYTYGRISYEQYRERATAKMSGVTNEIIKQALAKNMDAARVTENGRQTTKWSADYSAGRLPYEQYTKNLTALMNDPSQKSPQEIDKIRQTIDAAQLNEQTLEDNRAYVAFQGNPSQGAAQALAYFNNRLATSKNPKDAERVEQYIKSIQSSVQAKGNASAGAGNTLANDTMKQNAERYEKEIFEKELAAANGDPLKVMAAFTKRAQFYSERIIPTGGSDAYRYQQTVAQSNDAGRLEASKRMMDKAMADIADERKAIAEMSNIKDKAIDMMAVAARHLKIASIASKAEASGFLLGGHDVLVREREQSAAEVARLEAARMSEYAAAMSQSKIEIDSRYDALTRQYPEAQKYAQALNSGDPKMVAEAQKRLGAMGISAKIIEAGINLDGSDTDRDEFARWIQENWETNGAIAFGGATKPKVTSIGTPGQHAEDLQGKQVDSVTKLGKALVDAQRAIEDAGKLSVQRVKMSNPNLSGTFSARDNDEREPGVVMPLFPFVRDNNDIGVDPETQRENRNAIRGGMNNPEQDREDRAAQRGNLPGYEVFSQGLLGSRGPLAGLAQAAGEGWKALNSPMHPVTSEAPMPQSERDFGSAGYSPAQPQVSDMGATSWNAATIDSGVPSFINTLPAAEIAPPLVDPTIPQFDLSAFQPTPEETGDPNSRMF